MLLGRRRVGRVGGYGRGRVAACPGMDLLREVD